MKKVYYQIWKEIKPNIYLHYNTFSNQFLLLNSKKHNQFCDLTCSDIEYEAPEFYKLLLDNQFIVSDDSNEQEIALYNRRNSQDSSSMYQVVINTTLDCNLNCWYCYENRVSGSILKEEVIEGIKKNIQFEYNQAPFNTLKMSFFGGEPFFNFDGIKKMLDYAKTFCKQKDLRLIADFTTNATLITKNEIDYLKNFECHFQITLDGDREIHNSIKRVKDKSFDTYQKTIDALRLIEENISTRWIALRINFDNRILQKIDGIIADIDFLNRQSSYVILKKVWQIPKDKVDIALLHSAIQKLFDKNFLVDYYVMPKGCVCFAERQRQVLFNYDGKVFKCSTISSFDDTNILGKLDFKTGSVQWDMTKMAYWNKDMQPSKCKECIWFPACLGPCNRQLLANKGVHICTFDSINLTDEEYLVYLFKYNLLRNQLYSRPNTIDSEH